ncbi:hypothetical protein [Chitinasiproducens palmae]|uniref:Uncharacterized protein n=1 Tax=Chitinasiproducens palmae TaxID=1770053 RepID=A0A1H2PTC2_9BURK|nr:hypothetical protein [Chitinasiproducens palmae]SDV50359.1 hypothetical protein SAMN05216551_111128 [Chitinasiproducens palmae]
MIALPNRVPVRAGGAAPPRAAAKLVVCLVAVAALAGCKSLSGFTGAAAGIAAGTFSSNPAVGIGVGVTVQAATDELINRIFRNMQRDEQNRIALLASDLPIGEKRPWSIHHRIPFHDERGTLQVVRDISTPLAQCREVLFSVDDDAHSQWFLTPLCQRSDGVWKWAAAEPATDRWGSLQ